MKNFWLVFSVVVILVLSLFMSNHRLGNIFNSDLENSKFYGELGDVVYAAGDLGFILEQKDSVKSIKYLVGDQVVGECIWMKGNKNKLNLICNKLGLTILKKYNVENRFIIEGNSALLKYRLKGTNQNIQICYNEGIITIGSPIIYGNY